MLDYQSEVHPYVLPAVCIFAVVAKIVAAEILRFTAPSVERDEAIRRLRFAHVLFLASPLLLMILVVYQARRVDHLQAVVGVRGETSVPGFGIRDTHSRIAGETQEPGKLIITRNPDGTMQAVYTASTATVTDWVTQ